MFATAWLVILLYHSPASTFVIQDSYRITQSTQISASVRRSVDCVEGPFEANLLTEYWGRQPLLIRNAFDPTEILNEPTEIFELACYDGDNDAEMNTGQSARIIQFSPGVLDSYSLELGPFQREYIDQLGKNGFRWSLLVNDVDRYMPEVSDWMDKEFRFLPRWRRDDAQISVASKGGGIGPHVDNYDVFLVQSRGKRSWLVGNDKLTAAAERMALVPDISVSILKGDYDYSELLLEPGDVLYLPPRVVHWGTSLSDDCMTISVGSRAPSAAELVARVAEAMLDSVAEPVTMRYADENLLKENTTKGASLNKKVKDSMRNLVLRAVNDVLDDEVVFDELVGRLVTEPKRLPYDALHPWDDVDDDEYYEAFEETLDAVLDRVLDGKGTLYRAEGISFATSRVIRRDGGIIDRLYACGELFEIQDDEKAASVFERIEQGHALSEKNLSGLTPGLREILDKLVAEGFLDASDDSEEER
jgi:50S ribosomal protein L16 3-hydroxylase